MEPSTVGISGFKERARDLLSPDLTRAKQYFGGGRPENPNLSLTSLQSEHPIPPAPTRNQNPRYRSDKYLV